MVSCLTDQWITCYQGCIKRGHATPDTLPIDIEIPNVTKNSASVCSREYSFASISESLQVLLQCNGRAFSSVVLLTQACLLQYNKYCKRTYGYAGKVIHPSHVLLVICCSRRSYHDSGGSRGGGGLGEAIVPCPCPVQLQNHMESIELCEGRTEPWIVWRNHHWREAQSSTFFQKCATNHH